MFGALRVAIMLCVALTVANVAEDMIVEEETFLLSRPGAHKAEMALVQELAEDAATAVSTGKPKAKKAKASSVSFSIGCGKKALSGKDLSAGNHPSSLTKYSSLKVPAGLCVKLYELGAYKGNFVKIVGSHKSNTWCLKDRALSSKKTPAKNWAKQVRSAKIYKCKALSTREKNKNIKAIASATIKAATKIAYKKGKSLPSIASEALSDALKTRGRVAVGKVGGAPGLGAAAKRVSVCVDLKFKDAVGKDCAFYTKYDLKKGGLCKKFGKKKYNGKTANKQCCACGGGDKGVVPSLPPPVKYAVKKGKKGSLSKAGAINKNWYKYAKNHKHAWKKFVIPYPKSPHKLKAVKKAKKDGAAAIDDAEDKKSRKNSKGKNRIDGGLKVVHDKHKGFVSEDARLGPGGHYYIGRRRRRVGAGFGRRRRTKKHYVVRRRSAMPNVGITASKLTGKTPGAKPRCTHMKLKYKKKWPYCKKIGFFFGKKLAQAKHACRKNNLCIGFTWHGKKKNGRGQYLAPPCRFFGSGYPGYDYYVKDFKCPKASIRKPPVSRRRPSPVAPLKGYTSGRSYSSGGGGGPAPAWPGERGAGGAGGAYSSSRSFSRSSFSKKSSKEFSFHHASKRMSKGHALEKSDKKTRELAAVMHKALAKKKLVKVVQNCAKCVAEFKAAGGCTEYSVNKKDPSKLIPKGCSTCAVKCIRSCHIKGYASKVKGSKATHKAALKKLKKLMKKAPTVSKTYKELKKEAAKEAKALKSAKKAAVKDAIAKETSKISKNARKWAKKVFKGKEEAVEEEFTEAESSADEAPIRIFGVDY